MRRIAQVGMALIVVWLVCAASFADDVARIDGGGLQLAIGTSDGRIEALEETVGGRTLSKGEGGLMVFDGASESRITLSAPARVDSGENRLLLRQEEPGRALSVATEYRGEKDRVVVAVTVANRGAEQRLIELQLGLPLDYGSGNWRYWDGYDESVPVSPTSNLLAVNADPVVRHVPPNFEWGKPGHSPGLEAAFVFPVACVYNDSSGVAVGIDLEQILSYHASGVQPGVGPRRAFHYGAKLVLDPGRSETVTFIAFRFTPEFGWRNCAETVYELYPKHYEPRGDVDDRIFAPGGDGWDACGGTLISEQHRRRQQGWAWYMAPFQTTGLTFPDRVDWNPTRLNAVRERNISYDQFVHRVTDSCELMHDVAAVGFYVFNWRVDYYAAKRYYPNALTGPHRPPTPEQRRRDTVLGAGVEGLVGVCPLDETYFKRTVENYRRIAKTYRPDGLAFDNCGGASPYYFDKHVEGQPGRTFTKHFSFGHVFRDRKVHVCVRRGVAVKLLADEVHKLKNRDGKTFFLAANTPSDYLACGQTDVAIEERVNGPHFIKESPFWGLGLRKMMGRKPVCVFSGYRGETYDRHDFNLFCLHIGATRAVPWEKEGQALIPLLRRLSKAGWRAVPAATASRGLLLSRFGRGLGTHIVAINRKDEDAKTTIRVRNKYLGSGCYVLAHHDGKPAPNRFDGRDTLVDVTVPASGHVVLSAVARIDANACEGRIAAMLNDNRIELKADVPVRHPLAVRLPDGARLKSVNRGKSTIAVERRESLVRLDGLTTEPLELSYWPPVVFLSSTDEIRQFPFYTGDKPSSAVLFSKERLAPRVEVSDVAVRLAGFFAFHKVYTKTKCGRQHIMLDVANSMPWIQAKMLEWMEPNEAAVVVSGDAGIPIPDDIQRLVELGCGVVALRTSADGRPLLFIVGPDRRTVRETVDELLQRLRPHFQAFRWEG